MIFLMIMNPPTVGKVDGAVTRQRGLNKLQLPARVLDLAQEKST